MFSEQFMGLYRNWKIIYKMLFSLLVSNWFLKLKFVENLQVNSWCLDISSIIVRVYYQSGTEELNCVFGMKIFQIRVRHHHQVMSWPEAAFAVLWTLNVPVCLKRSSWYVILNIYYFLPYTHTNRVVEEVLNYYCFKSTNNTL